MSVPFVYYHSIPRVDNALFTIAHKRMKRILYSISFYYMFVISQLAIILAPYTM
jgi:hypothetical protein